MRRVRQYTQFANEGRSRPFPPKAVFGPAFTPGLREADSGVRCPAPFTGLLLRPLRVAQWAKALSNEKSRKRASEAHVTHVSPTRHEYRAYYRCAKTPVNGRDFLAAGLLFHPAGVSCRLAGLLCRSFPGIAVTILLVTLFGCSSDGRLAASGTVALDGKPLESGAISFQPAPGSEGHSAGGQITDGRFRLSADHGLKPGKYFVTVQSFKLTGRMVPDVQTGREIREQVLVKYNEAGKIEAIVAAGRVNHFDIQLTSAGGVPGS
jgi:hypothetical protein